MTVTEKIIEHVRKLPQAVQTEVLDFVEYMENKVEVEDRKEWADISLSYAMRGMESEAVQYSEKDIKESFA